MNKEELLTPNELGSLKGGTFQATSTQVEAFEMGDKSCCNITIKPGKNK